MENSAKYCHLLTRANLYASRLCGEIPEASSKYIPEKDELIYLSTLEKENGALHCRYQTCRLYAYLRRIHFKRLSTFEAVWDRDELGKYWLVGVKIYSMQDDQLSRVIAKKVELRGEEKNQLVIEVEQKKEAAFHDRFKEVCHENFYRILGIAKMVEMKLPPELDANRDWEEVYREFYLAEYEPHRQMLKEAVATMDNTALHASISVRLRSHFPCLTYLLTPRLINLYLTQSNSQAESPTQNIFFRRRSNPSKSKRFTNITVGSIPTAEAEYQSRYPRLTGVKELKKLQKGLVISKSNYKLNHFLNTHNVRKYVEDFRRQEWALSHSGSKMPDPSISTHTEVNGHANLVGNSRTSSDANVREKLQRNSSNPEVVISPDLIAEVEKEKFVTLKDGPSLDLLDYAKVPSSQGKSFANILGKPGQARAKNCSLPRILGTLSPNTSIMTKSRKE
jgi:hypothetical protein